MGLKIKKILNFFALILIIFLCSFFWRFIEIPFNEAETSIGFLTQIKYNHLNDTIRYLFFVGIPLIYYLFFICKIKLNIQTFDKFLIKKFKFDKDNFTFKTIWPIFSLLIFLLIIEFLTLDAPSTSFLDPLHHGDYLVPIINYLSENQFWNSSFTVHGGSNIFYPLIAWNLFGANTIGALNVFILILVLILKILSIIFIFYISKFSELETKYKIILFSILSLIILSLSNYYLIDYLSIRDIYALLFFIFFVQCFFKSNSLHLNFLISLITIFTIFINIDIGIYLFITLISYILYLLFSKKYNETLQIFLSIIFSFILVLLFFGNSEVSSFIFQSKQLIFNMDVMHGLKYPQPFFSMGIEPDGSRATKTIFLQLLCGIIAFGILFSKKNYFNTREKLFFLFFYVYSFIAFKSALGRSDGFHIMQSSDWQSLIIYYSLVHFIIFLIKKKKLFVFDIKFAYLFSTILIFAVMIPKFNLNNLIDFQSRFQKSINAPDVEYMSKERLEIINFLKSEIKDEKCIQNFTGDLIIPYLIKKPSCTKYFSSWLASGYNVEKDYISKIKNKNVKYIIYSSPMFVVDNIKTSVRLKYVNEFILDNYISIYNKDGYTLLMLKD